MTTIIYLLRRDVPPRWPSSDYAVKLFAEHRRGRIRRGLSYTGSVIGRQPLPTPASPRRARDGCQHLATRVLGNTFILGRTRHSPMNVCLPPNVVAFFRVFMRLQRVGHLTYWLSEFHARILSGSTARSRSRIASRGACSRTQWLVNLDIVLETTLTALSFSTLTALPAGHPLPWWSPQAPFQLCTLLVLCRVDAISLGSLAGADLVRRVFEDRPWAPVPGTAFVLTELEYVHRSKSVRVRMSETRVVRTREERRHARCCAEVRIGLKRSTKQPAAHRFEPAPDGGWDALLLDRAPLAVRPAARKPSPTGAKLSSKLQAFRQTVKPAGRDTGRMRS
ncbi:uncharacterized protein BXZ73DRAFT_82092 [Epithele typhae]|uniref:uncharacterized protein n=1 Tax=Epithele typhae TaxID=378194 RepID=UPI0020086213|nr:uncharacterized protein BXZ73DRAFT_82092 [Epithele typhae]KAH9912917.1 hypothetical protein BXZ73DRAFT_82092 [Epithele typhae]